MPHRYHVNDAGVPGACSAHKRPCPFGGPEAHHDTIAQARAAFEQSQGALFTQASRKSLNRSDLTEEWLTRKDMLMGGMSAVTARLQSLQVVLEAERMKAERDGVAGDEVRVLTHSTLAAIDDAQRREAELQAQLNEVEAQLAPRPVFHPRFNASSVEAAANRATSHNAGKSVLSAHAALDAVELRMSSWPRAREAAAAFQAQGWVTEFTGDDRGGELIRVYDPTATDHVFAKAEDLTWLPESQAFVIDASEFKGPLAENFTLISQRNQYTVRMVLQDVQHDREGEIQYWLYRPENSSHAWQVTIFND